MHSNLVINGNAYLNPLQDHTARGHSRLSPSGAHRWMLCPASVPFQKKLGIISESSEYAAEGTAVHEIIERCLKDGAEPIDFIGKTLSVDKFEKTITEKMADNAAVMVNFCRMKKSNNADLYSEIYLDLSDMFIDGLDGGTADCVIISHDKKSAVIADYKNGTVKVDVTYNQQLLIYAVGAIDRFELPHDCIVELAIIQPNVYKEPQLFSLTVSEIEKWRDNVLVPCALRCSSENPEFVPGEIQCKYCPCSGQCQHQNSYLMEQTKLDFSTVPSPDALTAEQKLKIFSAAEQIKKFIDEVVKSVTAEMLQGSKYSGLKLVRKATKRKFTELASDVVMSPLLDYLDEEEIFEKKIKGITEIEKLLKKRGIKDYKKIVDSCTEKPDGEVIAVEESDKRAEYIPQIEVKQ